MNTKVCLLPIVTLAAAVAAAGEFSVNGTYARWDERSLSVGNGNFSRVYRVETNGVLRTDSFKAKNGAELVRPSGMVGESLSVKCSAGRWSLVGEEGVRVEVLTSAGKTFLRVYPGADGPLVERPGKGVFEFSEPAPAGGRELYDWYRSKTDALLADTDPLVFAAPDMRVTEIRLCDRTDYANELVYETERLLVGCEHPWFVSGSALDVRDLASGNGVVFLRLAPTPESRPVSCEDFVIYGLGAQVAATANGYPVAELAYVGGDVGRTRALHRFQRCLRSYRPGRDGVFLSNTWGDGNRDSRINEEFLLKEVDAGAELGVDVIQIDDGWQAGRSANSAAIAKKSDGCWGKYWDIDRNFWKPCPVRFPNGLKPVVDAAKAKGLRFGLWFGPDSSNDFRHWEDDANCLIGYFRTFGIEYYKIDSVTIRSGVALDRQEAMFNRMLEESDGAMVFDLDCTASIRPGFLGLCHIGPLFVENRYIRKDENRLWHPHWTLRNLWRLSKVIDPVRLRMEVLNPLRLPELYKGERLAPANWPEEAGFAIAMVASPLGWFEISNLSPSTVKAMKPLVAKWKRERANLHGGITYAVGAAPDGYSWTGFVTEAADGNGGYALLFRELSDESSYSIDLRPYFGDAELKAEVLAGNGGASMGDGRLEVSVPAKLDYLWVRLEK